MVGALMMASAHTAPPATKPSGCLIEPEQVADVGSPVTGVIERLPVALGDAVEAGQTLAMLRADVERANAGVAALRSQVDAEVKAAQANVVLARQKVDRARQLLAQDFVSAQAVEQAVAEAEVAVQKLKMAQSQQRIYGQEQAVAQAQLGLRTLRSPIRGVVVERYSNLGERVEDRPVIRVASIDPLRVSLMVPIAQYGQVAVGDTLSIRPELPGLDALRATVQYVDKVVDAASNTFRVRLTLPNPDHRLPGGLRCKADWSSRQAAAQALPPGNPNRSPIAVPAKAAPADKVQRSPGRASVRTVSWSPEHGQPRRSQSAQTAADVLVLRPSWALSRPITPTPEARLASTNARTPPLLAQATLTYSVTLSALR